MQRLPGSAWISQQVCLGLAEQQERRGLASGIAPFACTSDGEIYAPRAPLIPAASSPGSAAVGPRGCSQRSFGGSGSPGRSTGPSLHERRLTGLDSADAGSTGSFGADSCR